MNLKNRIEKLVDKLNFKDDKKAVLIIYDPERDNENLFKADYSSYQTVFFIPNDKRN